MVGDPTRPWQVGSRVHRGLFVDNVWLLTEDHRGSGWVRPPPLPDRSEICDL